MNKRDAVLAVLDSSKSQTYIPAAFFLHFDASCHAGPAAVEKHLEFFRATDMDFVKIQYERTFPMLGTLHKPSDWASIPCFGLDFYEPQLGVVKGLVEAARAEAPVVLTLYSPFMCAGHLAGKDVLVRHMAEDPDAVCKGMEIVTESLMGFVRECIRLGLDGFYHSTQGAEAGRLASRDLFDRCVKPYDLRVMEEINRTCPFNILHVCDYHGPYADLDPFPEYPGHVVNVNPVVGDREMTGVEISALFGRPYMGGMERLGILAKGSEEEVRAEAKRVLAAKPDRFILAADCTVPADTPWANLRAAVDEAHRWG